MRVVIFCHSLVSDWNHGNAHFLRGVARELLARGHDVRVYEPDDAWSLANLVARRGPAAIRVPPRLSAARSSRVSGRGSTRARSTARTWCSSTNGTSRSSSRGLAASSARRPIQLLFHDTHHRSVTGRGDIAGYALTDYDGVLAFGEVHPRALPRARLGATARGPGTRRPTRACSVRCAERAVAGDLVWIGNWGDDERSASCRRICSSRSRRSG